MKGVKKHGMRIGNWLTAEQGKRLLGIFDQASLRGKRDYAMVAVLLGCGLRRAEVAGVAQQQREGAIRLRLRRWDFEEPLFDPVLCPLLFNSAGIVSFRQFAGHKEDLSV